MKPIFLFIAVLTISGCNSVFYHPDRYLYIDPKKVPLDIEELAFPSGDRYLSAWLMSPKPDAAKAKGLIIQYHGNAQNLTSHASSVFWLAAEGYYVLSFDYSGYGRSSGKPNRERLFEDGIAVLEYTKTRTELKKLSVFMLCQSLGGAVCVPSAEAFIKSNRDHRIKGLILESTFSSYRQMARMKLSDIWLTWPLQYPLSYLISDELSPVDSISSVDVSTLFIHAKDDMVVPYRASKDLYKAANEPKTLWKLPGQAHIGAFSGTQHREKLLKWLKSKKS
jgi:fermentation-respiration switch protein FrsA (DUF1100 family)